MKKLLSICFLSMLLGLLSFSVSAQNGQCESSGFWIENLKPVTYTGVVNAPGGSGSVVLNNTMNVARKDSIDLYELHFCPCGLDPKTKVSVDWLLYQNGQLVNDNLSAYADIDIYTFYQELNEAGECQSIHWLGGRVPNAFGYCNEPVRPDMFSGYQCNTPTNYPGALQVGYGTPGSVLNAMNEQVPAQGQVSLYSQAYDFFYLDFFARNNPQTGEKTRTVVQIKWKQVGNYSLVMRVRQRVGGTDWNNAGWGEDPEMNLVGGHGSCCSIILAQDSIHYLVKDTNKVEICGSDIPYVYGNPQYEFNVSMPDTNVVFGHNEGSGLCEHFVVDSMVKFGFWVRHNPVVQVANHIDTLCSCQEFTPDLFGITLDPVDLEFASDTAIQWYYSFDWHDNIKPWKVEKHQTDTTYIYIVRQVNTYSNFGETVVCNGTPDTLYFTFKQILPPTLPDDFEICLEDVDSNSVYTVKATHDMECANTTRWFTKTNSPLSWKQSQYLDFSSQVYEGDQFPIDLITYAPTTNKKDVKTFYAVSYDTVTGCYSKFVSKYTVTFNQTPELAKVTIPDSLNCPGAEVTMNVKVNNTPNNTVTPYIYMWNGITEYLLNGTTRTAVADPTQNVVTGSTPTVTYSEMPMSLNYKYNKTQQIYNPSEVGSGLITEIAFYLKDNKSFSKDNVTISLGTTSKESFAYNDKWIEEGLEPVFTGTVSATKSGWCTVTLDKPFLYNTTTENLVVDVVDNSNSSYSNVAFKTVNVPGTSSTYYKTLTAKHNSDITTATINRRSQRAETRFTLESTADVTNVKNQTAYNVIPDTALCGDRFSSSVYVIDGNGCVSQPVEFNYGVGDTIAPTVTPNTMLTRVNACDLDSNNTVLFKNIAELMRVVTVDDNCDENLITLTHTDVYTPGDCEKTLVRTYTLKDICGNEATFTHTFIAHDSVKPEFRHDSLDLPLVQLFPVKGGDCKYNAPDSMTFVNAIRDRLYDNCTDVDYLLSTLRFTWEHTNLSPINDTNIFRVNNHLTVSAYIKDRCNNAFDTVVIFFDRPDSMWISGDPQTLGPTCEDVTSTLVFDTVNIHGDANVGPFLPYTYQWREVNGRQVIFSNPNAKVTDVTPIGSGEFLFRLTVTDDNGCSAESPLYALYVNPTPNIDVVEITYNGETAPYCPNYGWMTVAVVDSITRERLGSTLYYTWDGEGVNTYDHLDTTLINIVPDSCDHDYIAYVRAEDEIGCFAVDSIVVPVRDTEGPIILAGTLHDTILTPNADCKLIVPNYRPLLNVDNVTSKCNYSPTQILATYTQTPAAGTITETDTTEIKITLSTPCGKDSTYIVYAYKPDNYVTVEITVDGDSVCENDPDYIVTGITLTANAQLGTAPYSYQWTKGASSQVIGTTESITIHDTNGVYTYHVRVKDAHNCPITDDADVTVWYKGAPAKTSVTPNRICEGHNGTLTIIDAPTGYAYNFQGQDKISDNDNHDHTINNTVYFHDLYAGTGWVLTITTTDGCVTTKLIDIPNVTADVDTVIATPYEVTNCNNNNGSITIEREAGFTYYFSTNGTDFVVTEATEIGFLSAGTYYFYRVNNATNCASDVTSVYVPYNAPQLQFTVNSTKNHYCVDNIGDGKLTLVTTGLVYDVIFNDDTIYNDVTAQTLSNLLSGTYTIVATNMTTGCSSQKDKVIAYDTTTPSATVISHPNRFCDENYANGDITVTNITQNATYVITNAAGDTIPVNHYDSLYADVYKIYLTSTPYGCKKNYERRVNDSKIKPQLAIKTKTNSTCIPEDFDGEITVTVKNSHETGAITSYTITPEEGEPISNTTGKFTGLASGNYNVSVVTVYGCVTEKDTFVNQYRVPAMDLDSTANYMCEPTITKPGNGTITIMAPRNTDAKHYHYKYYDGNGVEYDVPFNQPYVYTLYWLKDGMYRVTAYELETGCMAEDSIYVPLDRYEVEVSATATANKFCTQNFNGTVTVTATSTNPDKKFQYKLVGVDNDLVTEYMDNRVFTGLQNGEYLVFVRDTNTMCVYQMPGKVLVPFQENDLTVIPTVTPNHSCDPELYDGTITATATTTTFENPVYQYRLGNDGVYSENNSWNGLAPRYYTVYVMEMTSGCVADSTVEIENQDICAPQITISAINNNFYNQDFGFCKGQENAGLCANVTVNEACAQGDFLYKWYVDCHLDTLDGRCITVNTDEVHCCYYEVEVTSLATGCKNRQRVRVCITEPEEIVYRVNGQDFYGRDINWFCQNQDVEICIKNGPWISAKWSNSYVTPEGVVYDTCFTIPANSTVAGHMYSYCLDVVDSNGCSRQGILNFTSKLVPRVSVSVVECEFAQIGRDFFYHDTTVVRTYNAANGCDSIVTYNIHIIPMPEFDPTAASRLIDSVYCEGVTLGAIYDSANAHVKNAELLLQMKRNNNWVSFSKTTPLTYTYKDSTFRFRVWSICDTIDYEFHMNLNRAPRIDSFEVAEYYCASTYNSISFKVSTFNESSETRVKLFLKEEPTKIFTNRVLDGANDHRQITVREIFMPYAYNGKTLVLAMINECDSIAQERTLVVDTDFIHVPDFTVCEGDILNFNQILGTQTSRFTNLQAWIRPVVGMMPPAIAQLRPVLDMNDIDLPYNNQGVLFGNQDVDSHIHLNSNGKYYASTVGTPQATLRLLNTGNTLTITADEGYEMSEVTLYGVAAGGGSNPVQLSVDTDNVRISTKAVLVNRAVTVSNLEANSVKFTNSSDSRQFRIDSIAVTYNNLPDNTIIYSYGETIPYEPGTPVPYYVENVGFYDHAQIFFTGRNKCGNVISDTATMTVNPLPRVEADYSDQQVCLEDAVEFISTYPDISFADDTTWMYVVVDPIEVKEVESVQALVDSVKKLPSADILVKVSNGCDTITVPVMNVRIFDKLEITAVPTPTICPNATWSDHVTNWRNNVTVKHNNYTNDEYAVLFYGGTNFTHLIGGYDKIADVLYHDSIRVVAIVDEEMVDASCGNDTAYIRVTVLNNNHVEDTLQAGCDCTKFENFIKAEPRWTGSATVDKTYWTAVYNNSNLGLDPKVITKDSIMCSNTEPAVFFTWVTTCGDTVTTNTKALSFHYEATVTVKDTVEYCLGANFDIEDFDLTVIDVNSDDFALDTVITFGGNEIELDADFELTAEHNGLLLIASVTNDCGTNRDTTVVIVNMPPTPKAKGDDDICLEGAVTMQVVDPVATSTYTWFVEGENDPIYVGTPMTVVFDTLANDNAHTNLVVDGQTFTLDRNEFYYFTVVETDENGCSSVVMENTTPDAYALDVITVKSTNLPQFRFFYTDTNNVESETHHITGIQTGVETYYDWMIDAECPNDDELVFVEFSIYKDGVLIPNNELGNYFATRTGTPNSASKRWIDYNVLSWNTTMNLPTSSTMYYNSSVPGNHTAEDLLSGNHFPNTNLLGQGSADIFESLYLHFLNQRRVNVMLVPFRQEGEYTIVYTLYSTPNPQIIQAFYKDETCNCNRLIGAEGAFAGGPVTVLVIDSLKFSVTGPNVGPAAEPEVTPETAPELNVENNQVVVDMEVWPNPAPATTTTLKARVHNMAGNAEVTLTSLTGKQVYTGTTYIDNDNYYFEFNVNSLSVGSYILTVRTNDAVQTKKVIITTLAK